MRRRPTTSSAIGLPAPSSTRSIAAVLPGRAGSSNPSRSSMAASEVRGSVMRNSVRPTSNSRTLSLRTG
jgi:hypothetical protein